MVRCLAMMPELAPRVSQLLAVALAPGDHRSRLLSGRRLWPLWAGGWVCGPGGRLRGSWAVLGALLGH
jgi:hypothetical protein